MGNKHTVIYSKVGTPYNKIRDTLRPLDLLLFAGSDFVSGIIRYAEKKHLHPKDPKIQKLVNPGSFSHVGIVVTSEILDHKNVLPGKMYVWESTISGRLGQGIPDIDGKSFLGVQLRDFDALLPAYDKDQNSHVAVAHLSNNPLDYRDKDELKARFTEIFNTLNGTPYDANPIDLGAALCGCMRALRKPVQKITGTNKWLFCSELVAAVYRYMGIFPYTVNPENVLPMDLVGYDTDDVKDGGVPTVVKLPPIYIVCSDNSTNIACITI